MCLNLSLDALHVSDSLVHHQERRFGAVYRNWYIPAYTNCDVQLIKLLLMMD